MTNKVTYDEIKAAQTTFNTAAGEPDWVGTEEGAYFKDGTFKTWSEINGESEDDKTTTTR